MCAINGFNFRDQNLIERMNVVTAHRGPDGTGTHLEDSLSLGHNRLSIIDLSASASQPMYSKDKRFVIVYNGEIYNFKDLRKNLSDSYQFVTNSDTEVILASYRKWGGDCLNNLNGIFAFAIWDTKEKKLFLARDHVGVKPLYYFWDGKSFIFSSEIKAILEHDIPRKINTESLNHYLRIQYTPGPETMFSGIKKLPAAHYAYFDGKSLTLSKYWSPARVSPSPGSVDQIELLQKKVFDAVKRQLVSDRPLGLYLSGGIDSSVVLHAMSRLHAPISTFSVGFRLKKEEESEKFNADFKLARKTAEQYGTNHNEVVLSSDDVIDLFESVVWHLDEPISNPTEIPMFKLSEFTKSSVDVVLGGDGGDELFGGYERYRLSYAASFYQKYFPTWFRGIAEASDSLRKLNTPPSVERFLLFMFQKDDPVSKVLNRDFYMQSATRDLFNLRYFSKTADKPFETLLMDVDFRTWLVDESLMRSDKMGMARGLEVRVPLLDRELVEFAYSIPLSQKIGLFSTKRIFKSAFKDLIPSYLLNQPKRGWFSPGAKWLRHPKMMNFAREVLSEKYYSPTSDIFDWVLVNNILDSHISGEKYNLTILWELMTFQIWAKKFKVSI